MANHPNRNWKRKWTVDLDAKEARHDSGFVVRFRKDAEGWLGDAVAGVDKVHPMDAARRMREAGEVFERAVETAKT